MGAVLAVKVCLLVLAMVGPSFCQVDCPPFTADLLGSTTAAITTGLVRDSFAAITGETSAIAVQVHASNIVCLRSGLTRNTYSGVSVIVNYTCNGASNPACNGNPTNSQFDFECVSSPSLQWGASVDGSSDNIVTTPPTGNFATTLRSDCGVCISPARFPFGTITNNEQHCGSCDPNCNEGLTMCFNRVSSGCCNFYDMQDMCIAQCPLNQVGDANFSCVCRAGYTGSSCDTDIDECTTSSPCQNGGTCNNTEGSFTCTCPVGYTGDVCDMDIDECITSSPCQNGGTCNNTEGSFTCTCPMGYTGDVCDMDIDECITSSPCQNGGTCNNMEGSFTCTCPMGFTGSICDTDIDDCSPNPCQNGGFCMDGPNSFTCICIGNWDGATCSVCEQGYTQQRTMCVLACTVASCASCTKPDVCENCQPGFTLDKNGNCIERGVTSGADGNLLGIILGCVFGILLLLLFITILVIVIYVWRKRVTSRYSLPTVDKLSSLPPSTPTSRVSAVAPPPRHMVPLDSFPTHQEST